MLPAEDTDKEEKSGDDPGDGDHPYHPVLGAPAAIFGGNLHWAESTDKQSSMIFCDIYLRDKCKQKGLCPSNGLIVKTVFTFNIIMI